MLPVRLRCRIACLPDGVSEIVHCAPFQSFAG